MCRNAVGSDRSPLANGVDTGVFVLLGALAVIGLAFAFTLVRSSRSRSEQERHAGLCKSGGRARWEP